MANNSHGNSNEIEMAEYLNNKKIKQLNLNMKEFVKYICNTKSIAYNDETVVTSDYEPNNKLKQDIYITVNGIKVGISLKMGTGNSCHQEKIEDFVLFIKQDCNATDEICDLWRLFIWADGTLDGTGSMQTNEAGKIISRFNSNEFKKNYVQEHSKLQAFIDTNKKTLINRALFVGKYNSDVEFIYHGTYKQGRWISKDEVLNYQLNYAKGSDRACFNLGNLTIQAWNVSLKGNTEHKRGQIQIKYSSMKDDFLNLMKQNTSVIGTFLGDLEEYGLSYILNKDKHNSMWKTLLPYVNDFTDYYLVKVSTNQLSMLSNKKVKTKSDAYVIKTALSHEWLLSKEYVIDEADIKNLNYQVVHNTGVSIKLKDSTSYTYQKFTQNSFCKAFCNIDDVEFWLTCLLIYSSPKEIYKNAKIINDLGNTVESYLLKVSNLMGLTTDDLNNSDFWDLARKNAQNKIKSEIINNIELSDGIFKGKGWFNSPYCAEFIFANKNLQANEIKDFSITTGSGRSKGNYSIEIIPI